MASNSIHKDIISLLQNNREALELPEALQMNYLPEKGDALSYEPYQSPTVDQHWIDGSKVCSLSFAILAVTDGSVNSQPNAKAMGWLEAIGALFSGMNNFALSESRVIIQAEVQNPECIRRTEDKRVVYSISLSIRYEE